VAALITVDDLLLRPGFDGVDESQAGAVIDDASALVLAIADLDTDWTTATVPAEVIPVLVNMVRRGLHNPRGLTGEQLGDYGWQAQNAVAAAGIYATRQERRIIRKAAGTLGAMNAELDSDLPLPPWRAGSEFEDKFPDSL
jgi:hypothetical protein